MIKTILFNPFRKIAGGKALGLGLAIIGISSIVAHYSNAHFDGVLDVHGGSSAPIYVFFLEGLLSWYIAFIFLYITGLIISKSKIRAIDVAGTTALSRYPFFFIAFLLIGMPDIDLDIALEGNSISADLSLLVIISVLLTACIVWYMALLFNAFSISCNIKGTRAVWSFIAAIIVAETVSKIIFYHFYQIISL